jgi:hypothetical protein
LTVHHCRRAVIADGEYKIFPGKHKNSFLLGGKIVFPDSTGGTYPVVRESGKFSAGLNAVGIITLGGIVDISTGITYKFLSHFVTSYQFFPNTSK